MWKGILKVFTVLMLVAALFGAFDSTATDSGLSFDIVPDVSATLPGEEEGDDGGGGTTCPDGTSGCSDP